MKENDGVVDLVETIKTMDENQKEHAADVIAGRIAALASTIIPDYRLPLGMVIEQTGGKGTAVTVTYHPNSPIGKKLLKEMEYRYVAVIDRDEYGIPEYDDCYFTKEQAIVDMLNKLPWLKDQFSFADGWVGGEVHGPNAIVDMDFVVVDKLERTHLHRFTDQNIAKICNSLGVQFYQGKKRKG